ncbi:MarR family winged helix-turn-helix transcriptional regulator [Acidimangrovimonas sediminis]|uniref:MarR family winged helix-turn-helix transcriptional regulator n=1 Tax=Acidimangrovimonas sediminis TaxID=2056283 RepID=UPI0018EAB0ED|nr:MarR family transcriptional regulator [Acidimangrovimonas sediminis]
MTLAPHDMICFALYSAAHAMQQAYRPYLDELGLTYPQYLVMSALWSGAAEGWDRGAEQDPEHAPSLGDIAREVQLESSTLTPLVKRLEAAGLVTRRRDARDERQVRIHLTAAGREMRARAAHIPACIAEKAGMEIGELVRLRDEVNTLRDRMKAG